MRALALLIVVLGLAVLGWYAWGSKEGKDGTDIQSTTSQDSEPLMGSKVSISGTVVRIEDHGKVHFLKLSPAAQYPLVSFEPFEVSPKEKVKVTGKLKLYKGSPEVIVERITRID